MSDLDSKGVRIILIRNAKLSFSQKYTRELRIRWHAWRDSLRTEFAVILLAAGSFWLAAALISYMWYGVAWAGALGFYLSASLYTLFGEGVWALMLTAWYISPDHWADFQENGKRRMLSLVGALSAGALFADFFGNHLAEMRGGYVGKVSRVLAPVIGSVGMTLVVPLALIAASLATLGVSFQELLAIVVGHARVSSLEKIWKTLMSFFTRFIEYEKREENFSEGSSEQKQAHNPVSDAQRDSLRKNIQTSTFFASRATKAQSQTRDGRENVDLQTVSAAHIRTAERRRTESASAMTEGAVGGQAGHNISGENTEEPEALSATQGQSGHAGGVARDRSTASAGIIVGVYEEEFVHPSSERAERFSGALSSADQLDIEEHLDEVEEELPPFVLPDIKKIFPVAPSQDANKEAFAVICHDRARKLEEKLANFGVRGCVTAIRPGPVITLFEYEPDADSKISKITALEDDLALSLRALSIRIIAPVPGRNVVGFEIANEERSPVFFGEIATEERLQASNRSLPLTVGVDTAGNPVIYDLAKMPHLLVAGATGSGKSVGMNVMLVSLLCSRTPDELKVILIDPKRLEFAPYSDIPHLLFPIVTNPNEAAPILQWVLGEMERRYEIMAKAGVRNIGDYHHIPEAQRKSLERDCDVKRMPYIVIMVDELADLMMVAGKDIEVHVARIAQMARAAGIHMIVATQRPSVDVVTGLIKVNFPSRIAFRVSTKVDSRTIIDSMGAEKLLGKGDMLYMSPARATLQRLHGPFISDEEINELTDMLKKQRRVKYLSLQDIIAEQRDSSTRDEWEDPLYDEVCAFLDSVDEVSISLLQRKYRVGFNRSARLIEMLERDGYVAPAHGGKPRRVLK